MHAHRYQPRVRSLPTLAACGLLSLAATSASAQARGDQLEESVDAAYAILTALDANRTYKNLAPYGEPQLGSRGIYRAMGGDNDPADLQLAMLWVLNLSDGAHDLIAIAERAGLPLETLSAAADLLVRHDLLEEIQKGTD